MTTYVGTDDFKNYAGIPTTTTTHDALIAIVDASVYASINRYCGRVFSGSTATSARIFRTRDFSCVEVDDISSTTGLSISVDSSNTGTFDTTWATTDYELEPLNGIFDGQAWPYTRIHAINQSFPLTTRAGVQVTAVWGWPSTPAEVTQAAYILALDLFKLKDAPFGVAGTSEFGVLRIRENTQLKMLLAPFRKHGVML